VQDLAVSLEGLAVPSRRRLVIPYRRRRAIAIFLSAGAERQLGAKEAEARQSHRHAPPDEAARRKSAIVGCCWATCPRPGIGRELDDVDPVAAGDAAADDWGGDDDPGALGAGLKMQVCSWEAHT
jgi:hypothetical protein